MKQTKEQAKTSAARIERLTRDISEIHKLVDEGCAEISATAQMALKWLETPEGCQQLDVVAEALKTIRHSAPQRSVHGRLLQKQGDHGWQHVPQSGPTAAARGREGRR